MTRKLNKIKVYIKLDKDNNIISINSNIFLDDVDKWVYLDEGFGDRYIHASGLYFDEPLINDAGDYTFSFVDNQVIKN